MNLLYDIDLFGSDKARTYVGVGYARLTEVDIDIGNASYSGVITFMPGSTGAVPEPGAWALMILGFGGAGAVLRRARGQAQRATAFS